jgi:hypothetical protein
MSTVKYNGWTLSIYEITNTIETQTIIKILSSNLSEGGQSNNIGIVN